MKKIIYAISFMAATLAACGTIGQPEEPQEYPYSKITILSAREGIDTSEDDEIEEEYTNLFDGNYLNKW